jgi:HAE1 family hydrophobic/amphiphilic exporter-1
MKASIVLLLCLLPAWGQTMPSRVGVGVIERKLSLKDAIEMALKNNLEIEIERTNTSTAQESVKAAQGAFDPVLLYQPGVESRNTPASSVLQGAGGKLSENFLTQNLHLRQRLPWLGATGQMDFENGRTSTSNTFSTLNPLTTSRFQIGVTIPLLRNREIDRERAEILIRRKNVEVSEADLELRAVDVIARVEQAYWDLVAARQDVQVKADGVEWAREQVARNRRMIDSGSLAPVELSASEAELQRRVDTWYSAVGVVTEVENTLKTLLSADRSDPLWGDVLIPTEVRTLEPPETDDLRQVVSTALAQRKELGQVRLRQDANDVQTRLNRNLTKPQVNLVGSYWNLGIGGNLRLDDNPFMATQGALYDRLNQLSVAAGLAPLPPVSFGELPDNLVGGYGTALSNIFGGNYQSGQIGVAVDFNLRNRTAEANLAQSVIAERRLKLEQARLEQAIEAQVRNALQALETARQRMSAAEAGERSAKEKLDSEVRLFQTGESTNFLVLTRQNEYTDSRRRSLVAGLDFNKAVSRLEQAMGGTLKSHGVSVR